MKIAVVGVGAIGSTFALHLARAGHDVTVVARGQRLAQLQADQAIVTTSGERAAVAVSAALDPAVEYDLALVTVLASQVDAVLPSLRASAAKQVMFMFNTFEPLSRLRDAVGPGRFVFGFPAILASLTDGRLKSEVLTVGQITLATDARWVEVFTRAGIPANFMADMEPWLRTHAALLAPVMALGARVNARGGGVSWAEAGEFARGWVEGFEVVRGLGFAITPTGIARLSRTPVGVVTAMMWSASRMPFLARLGAHAAGEARTLIDAMCAAAPDQSATLRALRP